ncbi:hypothetical protein SAY87_007755 [Trapa incisa]|uniref:ENTH domain-containing protein n=1 Tax=Trapa incisa TaxID=236973 RepID=A0AAN7QFY0_9MYRT|nr:hypothetical protein SAY87_007755 [Trapa incisa]
MKKVFGQTVRDLKREVNKKVLKVSGVEQKVLDATNNEAWGPHGTHLSDIAIASRNFHEYQIIMSVIWKRINDTGKNWRHVYKALIVLEYLVENGSERVIDEIREHAHQISTLADFQYVDSNGDQGNNVRRKSQSLVMLLNDKEQIMEVRQRAAAKRDKFHNSNLGNEMYKPGGYGDRYDDDRYSGRDDSGYGRGREGGYKDDDRNGRNRDSYSYSRDSEERYDRDGYREDGFQDNRNGSRSGSVNKDGDHSLDDDGQYAARLDRKFSDQSINAPPSYEEAVGESQSPEKNERDEDTSSAAAPKPSSPTVNSGASPTTNTSGPSPPVRQEFDGFDPRASVPATFNTANNNAEMDLFGSLPDSLPSNTLASMPEKSTEFEADSFAASTGFGASDDIHQPFDSNPFGDAPFKALPSNGNSSLAQPSVDPLGPSLPPNTSQNPDIHSQAESVPDFGFGDSFTALSYTSSNSYQYVSHETSNPDEEIDILAGILPPSGPSPASSVQTSFSAPNGQQLELGTMSYGDISLQGGPAAATSQISPLSDVQFNNGDFHHAPGFQVSPLSASRSQSDVGAYGDFGFQAGPTSTGTQISHPTQLGTGSQPYHGHDQHQMGPTASSFLSQSGHTAQSSTNIYGDFGLQAGSFAPINTQVSSQPQTGTNMQFNEGSFKHEVGLSSSAFSDPSTNELGIDNFASQAGPTPPVTSQKTAPAGMNMPLNDGKSQHKARPLPSVSSSQSQNGQAILPNSGDFGSLQGPATISSQVTPAPTGINMSFNSGNFQNNAGPSVSSPYSAPLNQNGQAMQPFTNGNFVPPGGSSVGSFAPNMVPQSSNGSSWQVNNNNLHQHQISGHGAQHAPSANRVIHGNILPQSGLQQSYSNSQLPVSTSVGPLAIVPQQQPKENFQTKSTVWADTLSRGLVDLNISGPKTNPLSDIGVDFDSINRKEKRMEKQPATPVASTITMGKAMGSGSGLGRAGVSSLPPSPNLMTGNMGMGSTGMASGQAPGMAMGGMGMGGMGMAGSHGMGMGMGGMGGGYGGINQQPVGMNMGMGMNLGYNNYMSMGMNPGMGQGGFPMQQQQQQHQFGGGYNNPMMGGSGYPQHPYGRGYR